MSAYCFFPRVYHPRNPRATSLYQIVSNNYQEFLNVYSSRFENKYGYLRPEVKQTLTEYLRCGWETVKEVFQATLGRDDVMPEMVINIQTYGRWANWNPHLHGISSDGCFDSEGKFYPLPKISNITLEKVFTTKVLAMLLEEKLITEDIPKKILPWKHTGFSAHTKVCIGPEDKEGLQGLAQYIVRCPISEDKIILLSQYLMTSRCLNRLNCCNP